jgi:hypothetical protein
VHGLSRLDAVLWLAADKGKLALILENSRSKLPASVTIDASGVDEKIARGVFLNKFFLVSHVSIAPRAVSLTLCITYRISQ